MCSLSCLPTVLTIWVHCLGFPFLCVPVFLTNLVSLFLYLFCPFSPGSSGQLCTAYPFWVISWIGDEGRSFTGCTHYCWFRLALTMAPDDAVLNLSLNWASHWNSNCLSTLKHTTNGVNIMQVPSLTSRPQINSRQYTNIKKNPWWRLLLFSTILLFFLPLLLTSFYSRFLFNIMMTQQKEKQSWASIWINTYTPGKDIIFTRGGSLNLIFENRNSWHTWQTEAFNKLWIQMSLSCSPTHTHLRMIYVPIRIDSPNVLVVGDSWYSLLSER